MGAFDVTYWPRAESVITVFDRPHDRKPTYRVIGLHITDGLTLQFRHDADVIGACGEMIEALTTLRDAAINRSVR